MQRKILLSIILICFFVFCGSKKEEQIKKDLTCNDFKSIKIGMTLDQVKTILGQPMKQDLKPDAGYWTYTSPAGTWIIKFQNGKVVDSTSLGMGCP